jgi:hypothetical protein
MRWWQWLVGGDTDDVTRVTKSIIVVVLALAGGSVVLLLLNLLVRVSEWTVFGTWGVVGVVAAAVLLALVTLWRRPARPARGVGVPPAPGSGGGPARAVRAVTTRAVGPVPAALRPNAPPPVAVAPGALTRQPDPADLADPDQLALYKARISALIEQRQYDQAETLLLPLERLPAAHDFVANTRLDLQQRRQRR